MAGRPALFKAILIGDSGVGKTSLINRYVNNQFSDVYKATIGSDFLIKPVTVNGAQYTLQIWDTAGHERYSCVVTTFYRGSDCCVLCFDVTNRDSFNHLEKWKNEFIDGANATNPASIPIYVVGNKIDCEPNKREVSQEQAREWCKLNGHKYFETSAMNAENVTDLFTTLAEDVVSRREDEEEPEKPAPIIIQKQSEEKKEGGCC
ncbi:Rab family GTPase [Entamoeba histolytica HM-1:IMSS-B]|uniref:Ras-related protein Rab-7b n=6 Tax=Entamoeba histolytica TaxID=5759 RepID=A0A8U0WNY7_ENTH1|nr:Rab family GTPase [Entamoeba histolytica HM-1:IMSS]EMD49016.1 Rab family gtpase [Entamoeba histolytica KU27]EMH72700.1 Rab family GTPase [Entamoeba histolytica HM-1:IMSS-B]EMS15851.1 Rab family GTPase [Entamoeba histolytica HM-3:IMSS]ENY65393.1 Rab family GTPase, putative [Entamoeba histolytica HM-1:IMSS-A]BAD34971.1 EhRab7D protein [Entamoeba histolytica]|eukprot:XP_651915.1 Rab family GTPase [Entamoeba histolytica HM-1:IMSS]